MTQEDDYNHKKDLLAQRHHEEAELMEAYHADEIAEQENRHEDEIETMEWRHSAEQEKLANRFCRVGSDRWFLKHHPEVKKLEREVELLVSKGGDKGLFDDQRIAEILEEIKQKRTQALIPVFKDDKHLVEILETSIIKLEKSC